MAVDGSLVFNTKIDTDGIVRGEKNISAKMIGIKAKMKLVQNQAEAVKKELEALAEAPVESEAAKAVEKKISAVKSELKTAIEEFNRAEESISQRSTDSKGNFDYKAFEARQKRDPEYLAADKRVQSLNEKLARYQRELDGVKKAEGSFTGKDTAVYREKQEQLEKLELEFAQYSAQLRETEQAERDQADAAAASGRSISDTRSRFERTVKALKMLANGAAKAGRALKSAFSHTVGKLIRNIGNRLRGANKSTNMLEKSLRRIKNTLVRMFFFRLVHSPIDVIKDGLGEISKVSPELNKNLSALKTETTYLKNSLAALAAPLVNLITPALTSFTGLLSSAADKAAQLAAALAGQTTYTKAVKTWQDYASSLDDTTKAANDTKKSLAGFDELNVLDTGDDDSTSAASAFQADAPVGAVSDSLLDALKNSDFASIGEMIGEKINESLQKINWGKIKATLKGWAANILAFLNGFVSGVDWSLVGSTLANGIVAALIFAQNLVRGFDFSAFGTAIGNLINGFLSPNNAAMLADTVSLLFSGLMDMMTSAVERVDWDKVTSVILAFITNFKFADISRAAVKLINSFASGITKIDFKAIGAAFSKGLSRINWRGIWNGVVNLFTNALQALTDFFGLKGVSTTKLKNELKNIYDPVSELFSTLKKTVSDLIKPLINKLLPEIVRLAGSVLRGVKPIISAVTPIIEKVIEVVAEIANSLAPAVETLGSTIGKIVDAVSPIITPLLDLISNIVSFLSPAVEAIFGFIGGAADLIGGFFEGVASLFTGGSEEPTISAKLQEELDHLSRVSDDLSNVKENINGTISSVDEELSSAAGNLQTIDELKSRMDELLQKSTLSDSDMQELNTIADLLDEKLPGFKTTIAEMGLADDEGKIKFTVNREEMQNSIDGVIDKMKEQYAVEALQDQYKELYSQKIEANKKIAESADEVAKAQSGVKDKQDAYNDALKRYDDVQKSLNDMSSTTSLSDLKEAEKNLKNAKAELNLYKGALDDSKNKLKAAYGAQGELNSKMEEINGTIDVMSGKFDKNKDDLQKLRDAYNLGFIDADELKKKYNMTAEELFRSTKSAAERSAEGYIKGLTESSPEMDDKTREVLETVLKVGRKALDINSPSGEFEEIGEYSIEGMEQGIEKRTPALLGLIRSLTQKIAAAMKSGLSRLGSAFDVLPGMFTSRLNLILDAFERFVQAVTSGINTTLAQINSLDKAYATAGGRNGSYTTWSAVSAPNIPRLATGTVIPANYGEFLAVLGDNRRETEIVAPVSAIKQALLEALSERSGSSGSDKEINLYIDGDKLFTWLIGKNSQYEKSHGYSALRGTES